MKGKRSTFPKEVFLSHSSKDRRFAEKVAEVLRSHGLSVWYSGTNIRGAQQWHDEIGLALARCDWFVLILSRDSVKSYWVKRELMYALRSERYLTRIVPVLHKRCNYGDLSWTLEESQFVNFTTAFDDGCKNLLRVWGLGYNVAQRRRLIRKGRTSARAKSAKTK